jgi:hypothetical protein
VLLAKLNLPIFRLLFQLMVFAALLESGTGAVHAINERVAGAFQARLGRTFGIRARALCALACWSSAWGWPSGSGWSA